MRVSKSAMAEIERAIKEWNRAVDDSNKSGNTKRNYKCDVGLFLQWLHGDYSP